MAERWNVSEYVGVCILPKTKPSGEAHHPDHRQWEPRTAFDEVLRPGMPPAPPGIVGGVGNKKGR